jgi:hypothetical protein
LNHDAERDDSANVTQSLQIPGTSAPADGKDGQCRPNPDESKRANARWLAVKIAVKAQRGASQRRSTEPQSNVEIIHGGTI